MAQVMTDKKKVERVTREGIPCSPESLAEYEKVWTDMDEGIAWCYKHPCKLDKKKK